MGRQIAARLGLDQAHICRKDVQGFAMKTAEDAEHFELGGMVSRGARGRAHRSRSMACHAGQNLARFRRKSPCGQSTEPRPSSAPRWILGPKLRPAVYKSRHDHATGRVDLECASRGTQILHPARRAGLGNASIADQQSPVRNNIQIAQFRAATRSCRAAQRNKLVRPADQNRFGL